MRSCNQQVCSENENEVQCQNGLEYFECGPCDSICGSNENCNTCAPSGCYCPKGLVFSSIRNEKRCVPKTECGCIFKNKYQKPGSEVAITNCEVCVCQEGKLSHCKVKSDCHHEDPAICSWSSWGSWGPCFGPCGVNGIQWSFRSPAVPSVYGIGERCQVSQVSNELLSPSSEFPYISYTDELANLVKNKFTDQQVPIKNCSFRVLRKKVGVVKPLSVVFVMTTKG